MFFSPRERKGARAGPFREAAKHSTNSSSGIINVQIERRVCKSCGKEGFAFNCECGSHTEKKRSAPNAISPRQRNVPNAAARRPMR